MFADSISNFDSFRIAQLFKHTGALVGVGYAALPKGLILGPDVGLYGCRYSDLRPTVMGFLSRRIRTPRAPV